MILGKPLLAEGSSRQLISTSLHCIDISSRGLIFSLGLLNRVGGCVNVGEGDVSALKNTP